MSPGSPSPFTLADWRRRVFAIYAAVRASADHVEAHGLWRRGRDALFAEHPDSPLSPAARSAFTGIPVAPYDPALRFVVDVDEAEPARREVPTGTDGVVPFERVGVVRLGPLGSLDVWRLASYGGGLFVPMRDGSAGQSTYGGGRYVLDTVKGADLGGTVDPAGRGALVVDLNFAYHPSCAYDPAWACPLAPPGNVIDAAVGAGEQLPPDGWY